MAPKVKQTTTVNSLTRGKKIQYRVEVSGPNPTLILAINANRLTAYIHNISGAVVYIGPQIVSGVPLSAANGIPLVANTGNYDDWTSYDEWWAISADGALAPVVVLEVSE